MAKKGKYVTFSVTIFIPEKEWKGLLSDYRRWIVNSDYNALDRLIGYSASREMDHETLMNALMAG